MKVTREDAAALLVRVHAVLNAEGLPVLNYGLCYLLEHAYALGHLPSGAELKTTSVYAVIGTVFDGKIPYYRGPNCPPAWKRGVWSEERMTLLCMLGALSADDIVEMCQ